MNKHGLTRDIPDDVKRAVRQRCGFGCIFCGRSLIDYDHVDPEFAEATAHIADGIALLCGSCHDLVTRRVWSRDKVKHALGHPRCKEKSFSWGDFDFGNRQPAIHFAGVTLTNCRIPLAVRGHPLFRIDAPEAVGGPFRLSAKFFDSNAKIVLEIVDNEWRARSDAWDVEFAGPRITIRERKGKLCLVLLAEPPTGLRIERLHMRIAGRELIGDAESLHVISPQGGRMTFTHCVVDNCSIGLSL